MRKIIAASVVTVLMCVSLGSAGLVNPRGGEVAQIIPAGTTRSYVDTFTTSKTQAIVQGVGQSCMGLYVFDSEGNCLAKDDLSSRPATADDLIVEWHPVQQGRYCVDLRNAGFEANKFQIALR